MLIDLTLLTFTIKCKLRFYKRPKFTILQMLCFSVELEMFFDTVALKKIANARLIEIWIYMMR